MGRELDSEHRLEILCDVSADISIYLRVGAGKVKHFGVPDREEDTKDEQLPRCIDTPLGRARWTLALSEDESAPLRTVMRDCIAREGVWSCCSLMM